MNKQQIFDTAVAALMKQGRPSYDRIDGACLYRGPDGTKCAIGHLIPDEKYYSALEGASPLEPDIQVAAKISSAQSLFACSLQQAHDGPAAEGLTDAAWPAAFKERVHAIAKDYRLSTKVLGE